jgi:hypothetical protein
VCYLPRGVGKWEYCDVFTCDDQKSVLCVEVNEYITGIAHMIWLVHGVRRDEAVDIADNTLS